jgi:hypothetical protein
MSPSSSRGTFCPATKHVRPPAVTTYIVDRWTITIHESTAHRPKNLKTLNPPPSPSPSALGAPFSHLRPFDSDDHGRRTVLPADWCLSICGGSEGQVRCDDHINTRTIKEPETRIAVIIIIIIIITITITIISSSVPGPPYPANISLFLPRANYCVCLFTRPEPVRSPSLLPTTAHNAPPAACLYTCVLQGC